MIKLLYKDVEIANGYVEARRKTFDYDFPMHWHDFFEIEFFISGGGNYIINNSSYPIKPGMVFFTNAQGSIADITRKSWIFLILSGLATGLSWLCYYKALQMGEVSKVVPIDKLSVVLTLILSFIFLHEEFTFKSLLGCILLTAGTLVMIL